MGAVVEKVRCLFVDVTVHSGFGLYNYALQVF